MNSSNVPRAQKTWEILATLPGEAVDAIFVEKLNELAAANGISPSAIELTAAAAKRTSPAVVSALAALGKIPRREQGPARQVEQRSLEGGDPVSGAALFASHPASECMRCHRAEEGHAAGGETAPNLAGIANRHKDRRYFLESMVNPSAVIAPGFGTVLIDFKNGASLGGNLIAETPDHLDLDASGKFLRVKRGDIASFTPPVSPMPPMGSRAQRRRTPRHRRLARQPRPRRRSRQSHRRTHPARSRHAGNSGKTRPAPPAASTPPS